MNTGELIDTLQWAGYQLSLDGVNLHFRYAGTDDPPKGAVSLLEEVREHKAEVLDYLRLLQTPQAKIERPILIESAYLKDTLYLVANEAQAKEIEKAGGICYLPAEIRSLLSLASGTDQEGWGATLRRLHEVKKVFRGSRIAQRLNEV